MYRWESQRDSRYHPDFLGRLEALGVTTEAWDGVAPAIENVLCGCSEAALDDAYPAQEGQLRIFLTDTEPRGVPPLRVSFYLDSDGAIVYHDVDLREP